MDPVNSSTHIEERFFWGWIVVLAAFIITATICGSFFSFGVFVVPITISFGWSRGFASGVFFIGGLSYALSVPFMGLLADRHGYRRMLVIASSLTGLGFLLGSVSQTLWQMYVSYGLLTGLGLCGAAALPIAAVSRWFKRRRGLALGLAMSGIGVGTATVPLLATYFISEFGWRIALSIIGVFIWVICIPTSLIAMRNPKTDEIEGHESSGGASNSRKIRAEIHSDYYLSEAVQTAPFWLLFCIFLIADSAVGLTFTHLIPHSRDMGYSAAASATLLSTMGGCSIIGRILLGYMSDKYGAREVLFVCLLMQGVLMIWLISAHTMWMFQVFAVFFGIFFAGALIMVPKVASTIFGVKSMGAIFGGLSVADGLGIAVGPLLAGFTFDVTGSYLVSFLIVAAGMILAAILTFLLKEIPPHR